MRLPRCPLHRALVVLVLATQAAWSQIEPGPLAPPRNGPRSVEVGWSLLRGVTVHPEPGIELEHCAVELRDGRILRVVPDKDVSAEPAGPRVFERQGLHVYAGFIDPYIEVDVPAPDRNAPGVHWNTRVTPQRSALDGTGLDAAARAALRKLGFCSAAISPKGGVFRGRSALVPLSDPPSDAPPGPTAAYRSGLYQAVGFDTAGFGFRGGDVGPQQPRPADEDPSRWDRYPGSLMGAIALIRQTLSDALWEEALKEAGDARYSPSALDSLFRSAPAVRLVFDASDALDVLRAAKIAREFDRAIVVLGSGTEYQRLHAITAQGLPLILPPSLPAAPEGRLGR